MKNGKNFTSKVPVDPTPLKNTNAVFFSKVIDNYGRINVV